MKELNGEQFMKLASYDPGLLRLIVQNDGEKFDHNQYQTIAHCEALKDIMRMRNTAQAKEFSAHDPDAALLFDEEEDEPPLKNKRPKYDRFRDPRPGDASITLDNGATVLKAWCPHNALWIRLDHDTVTTVLNCLMVGMQAADLTQSRTSFLLFCWFTFCTAPWVSCIVLQQNTIKDLQGQAD